MYNAQFDLRGQQIDNTYTQLLQYDTASGASYTGQGLQLSVSASYTPNSDTASFVLATGVHGSVLSATTSSFAISSSYAIVASTINGTSGSLAPLNQTTASAWLHVIVNGLTFYLPLYH